MQQDELEEIQRNYTYDLKTGLVHVNRSGRKLVVTEDTSSVSFYLPERKKIKKMNLSKLCWCMFHNKTDLPEGVKILHKNLQTDDNRMQNLVLVKSEDYHIVKEAVENLVSFLKLNQHPYDQYSYVIKYREGSKIKTEVVLDVVSAKKRFAELQLKFAKIAGKYCTVD
jgi:CRISPR/Cas system CMR-associated protein Cmr5 small subunit